MANREDKVFVLDVATGSGVWGIALAQKSKKVSVSVVDWAAVLNVTRKMVARFDLKDQFTFIEGDISEVNFGTGYTVATLGHILHSEGEKRSQRLIKKTFDAFYF